MTDGLDLFGGDDSPEAIVVPAGPLHEALPDWQVSSIRTALDRAGLVAMEARQPAASMSQPCAG